MHISSIAVIFLLTIFEHLSFKFIYATGQSKVHFVYFLLFLLLLSADAFLSTSHIPHAHYLSSYIPRLIHVHTRLKKHSHPRLKLNHAHTAPHTQHTPHPCLIRSGSDVLIHHFFVPILHADVDVPKKALQSFKIRHFDYHGRTSNIGRKKEENTRKGRKASR